jgi:DNA-binding protein Fis
LIFSRGCPIAPGDLGRAVRGEMPSRTCDVEVGEEAMRRWVRKALAAEGAENLFDACMDVFAGILVREALDMTGGNRSRAARLLGLSRPTLLSKIEKYRLKVGTSVTSDSP